MKNENIKKENRKALPKFFLIIVLSALGGGVLGYCSGYMGRSGAAEALATGLLDLVLAVTPWGIPVSGAVLLGAAIALYLKAKRLARGWDGEDEDTVDRVDLLLNWSLMWTNLAMLLGFFFLAAANLLHNMWALGVVGFFIAEMAVIIVLQQKIVDLIRALNPEKQGSVYEPRFQKKWLESCDEAERAQIGQASRKAYKAANTTCMVLWLLLVMGSYIFDIGLLPVFLVMLIWGVLTVTYTLECIKLSKKQ